jgi:hypothetical protein
VIALLFVQIGFRVFVSLHVYKQMSPESLAATQLGLSF